MPTHRPRAPARAMPTRSPTGPMRSRWRRVASSRAGRPRSRTARSRSTPRIPRRWRSPPRRRWNAATTGRDPLLECVARRSCRRAARTRARSARRSRSSKARRPRPSRPRCRRARRRRQRRRAAYGGCRGRSHRGRVERRARARVARPAPRHAVRVRARAARFARAARRPAHAAARDLPLDFALDDSMAMAPGAMLSRRAQVVVEARVSTSGNATPASGDLVGQQRAGRRRERAGLVDHHRPRRSVDGPRVRGTTARRTPRVRRLRVGRTGARVRAMIAAPPRPLMCAIVSDIAVRSPPSPRCANAHVVRAQASGAAAAIATMRRLVEAGRSAEAWPLCAARRSRRVAAGRPLVRRRRGRRGSRRRRHARDRALHAAHSRRLARAPRAGARLLLCRRRRRGAPRIRSGARVDPPADVRAGIERYLDALRRARGAVPPRAAWLHRGGRRLRQQRQRRRRAGRHRAAGAGAGHRRQFRRRAAPTASAGSPAACSSTVRSRPASRSTAASSRNGQFNASEHDFNIAQGAATLGASWQVGRAHAVRLATCTASSPSTATATAIPTARRSSGATRSRSSLTTSVTPQVARIALLGRERGPRQRFLRTARVARARSGSRLAAGAQPVGVRRPRGQPEGPRRPRPRHLRRRRRRHACRRRRSGRSTRRSRSSAALRRRRSRCSTSRAATTTTARSLGALYFFTRNCRARVEIPVLPQRLRTSRCTSTTAPSWRGSSATTSGDGRPDDRRAPVAPPRPRCWRGSSPLVAALASAPRSRRSAASCWRSATSPRCAAPTACALSAGANVGVGDTIVTGDATAMRRSASPTTRWWRSSRTPSSASRRTTFTRAAATAASARCSGSCAAASAR